MLASEGRTETIDAHVVILNNYLRSHHVKVYEAIAQRVRRLTVLLGTPMEPNRHWEPSWGNLDVVVQKNWTLNQTWKHSTGFREPLYVHIPIDTLQQLRRLKPDIVFSAELGMRTLLASLYGRLCRNLPVVAIGNMSWWIEKERGLGRRTLRRLLRRTTNHFTYNGPGCKKYLQSLGITEDRMSFFPYYYDEEKIWNGPRPTRDNEVIRLIYSGRLSIAKGIRLFAVQLERWCHANPTRTVELIVCGYGDAEDELKQINVPNCRVDFRGQCDDAQLQQGYADADMLVFPSLADEWGLVPIEAWKSGIPVLGSLYAQSIETHGQEAKNGWFCFPDRPEEFQQALDRALSTSKRERAAMELNCRETVSGITPEHCANYFCHAIVAAKPSRP
jgi:glycosyltransferase involved in cell wall biosynthesis